MQRDQRGRPFVPPDVNDRIVESEDVPTYMVSVAYNGRRLRLLNRLLQPFGRLVFTWLAWRQKRRSGRDARTS
jgi:hypothetical protein